MRARLAAAAAAAVLLTGCAGTAVDELPPSALESMEALAAFAREQNDGELAPVVSTPHQHKIEQDTEGLPPLRYQNQLEHRRGDHQ